MGRASRISRIMGFAFAAILALLVAAPMAMAADGIGLAGRVSDKTITFFCFGVILFFPLLVIVLSAIQDRLTANKDRRRHELERFDSSL